MAKCAQFDDEELYKVIAKTSLRIVLIVSGALNDAAAKKYDLEGWFPASCPVPTVQSTKLEDLRSDTVRNKNNEQTKQYVHMLTSTLTATEFRHSQELPARLTFLPFKTKPFVTETKGKKS
ncbi:Serine--tRNA ligase [Raphanus sativus]|nr:Serine--tRNA ligase [Raphanus sativus]KAJ4869987.1 Serine--tRNA ligase [Raphanus sativus]